MATFRRFGATRVPGSTRHEGAARSAEQANIEHQLFLQGDQFDRQFGLNERQFESDQQLREQLLGLIGGGGFFGGGNGGGAPGGDLFNSMLGDINNFGESGRAKINRDFDASLGSVLGNLESRGLGSSNLSGAAQSQVDEARQQSLLGLEDSLLGQKIGAKSNQLDRQFGFTGQLLGLLR